MYNILQLMPHTQQQSLSDTNLARHVMGAFKASD